MEEITNQQSNEQINSNFKPDAPNAMAVLILGIISLVLTLITCGVGGGVVTGIIGLVLGSGANKKIAETPDAFAETSVKNVKTGKTMSLIGLIVSAIGITIYFGFIIFMLIAEAM